MAEFLLYGLDEDGRPAHSEVLRRHDRAALRGLAEERLRRWDAVEIWEGPVCLVRVRRERAAEG